MALQGMDIEVHDIDIQTNQYGAYEIESFFLNTLSRQFISQLPNRYTLTLAL